MNNKVALVTGGGSWIGREIAHTFQKDGYRVMLTGRTSSSLQETIHYKTHMDFCVADLRRQEDVEEAIQCTLHIFGRIDVVIHSAAIYPQASIESMSLEQWQDIINTNLTSTFLLTKSVIPIMKAQKWGRILYISSIAGNTIGLKKFSAYTASKGGVNGFMRTAALELAPYNITVNTIDPGNICNIQRWNLDQSTIDSMIQTIPLKQLGQPQDVAEMALFLASEKVGWITGQNFVVDGGETIQ